MKAVVLVQLNDVRLQEVDKPRPADAEVLVKVEAATQNPMDWKIVEMEKWGKPGAIIGCAFAGVIKELGSNVPSGEFKVGDRVAGTVYGGVQPGKGAFAEYTVADPNGRLVRLSGSTSFIEGATLGICSTTALQMQWQSLELYYTPSSPSPTPTFVLVWSAASGVGQYAVQFARLSGLRVIATASAKHHAFIRELGAEEVWDYRDPDVAKKIKEYTKGELRHAFDCISEKGTAHVIAETMSDVGGTIAIILQYESFNPKIRLKHSTGFTFFNDDSNIPLNGKDWRKIVPQLLADGKLKFPPPKIIGPGLAGVPEGLAYHKAGKVSGDKITYVIKDTP